jgi:AraC-like DNA-binding protein
VATQRSSPIIIRIAKDDALIFGPYGIRGDTVRTAYAYRLKGDSVHIPLFETWLPISAGCRQIDASFIGDEAKGDFTYLVPVKDSTGQVAIARFSGTEASLLPTACAIPMTNKGDSIIYCNITADRQSGRAYLFGLSKHFQTQQDNTYNYILCIDYAHASDKGAPMKLYYTDPLEMMPDFSPILTPEGHLLIAGGLRNGSNFTPAKNVYLLHVGQPKAVEARSAGRWWIWAGLALAGLCIVGIIMMLRRRKSCDTTMECAPVSDEPANELMSLINELMDKEKPYLNSELKVSDIADAFHLHRNDISACINSQMGCTFAQYINRYRIEYAKELMRRQPDKKISSIWMESGFGSEQTFFKTFRSATGLSPKEWYLQEND